MTIKGCKKLREELRELKSSRRPNIILALAEARQHGDLKENAEYHAAREEQSFCEGRIQEIENKLFRARVIDITKLPRNERIVFGVTVTVLSTKKCTESTYCIVGDDEANFKEKLISVNSPMARGLMGKRVGETTTINAPGGETEYIVVKIEYI
jgi:transcription elongation factor GreA